MKLVRPAAVKLLQIALNVSESYLLSFRLAVFFHVIQFKFNLSWTTVFCTYRIDWTVKSVLETPVLNNHVMLETIYHAYKGGRSR